ncbi:hypothetical protein E3C22_06960 [Jiella endophytica]|uniref:Bacterial sugar transferase domain-containing protein n=1 Tax=Jiella endophytica TaxID=2558362 RepID=A0A4Y8RQN7_9HYPH|nr:sugar transferase [Jiella endophytica]TFF25114.1 hypothetical protein E3C22_06960 [Jiella endophytica]
MYRTAFFAVDLALIFLATLMAVALRGASLDVVLDSRYHLLFAGIASLSALVVWPLAGLLRRPWRYFAASDAIHLVAAVTGVVLITLFLTFTINRSDFVARSVPLLQWCLSLTLLVLARIGVRSLPARPSAEGNRLALEREYVLLVGFNRRSEVYLRCIEALYAGQVSVVGILDEDPSVKGLMLKGKPVIGRPANLLAAIRRLRNHGVEISRVVVTVPRVELSPAFNSAYERLQAEAQITLDHFEGLFGAGEKAQPLADADDGWQVVPTAGGATMDAGRAGYLAAKRVFDFTLAFLVIVLLAPLYLLLAALVAIDLGRPVTFWQERPGRFRRPFRVYKFRTMRDAYDLEGNAVPEGDRLSPIGAALRRLRLDELPQLFNILVGNMSFVGPRPLLPVDQPARPEVRLSMRPGLTGWAQVNGGRDLSVADKGALDCWYVENAGLLVDAKIILLTLRFVLTGDKPPRQTVLDQARGVLARQGLLVKVPSAW